MHLLDTVSAITKHCVHALLIGLTECDTPSTTTTTSKDELLQFFKMMYTMRRMEITNDTEYKVKHLWFVVD